MLDINVSIYDVFIAIYLTSFRGFPLLSPCSWCPLESIKFFLPCLFFLFFSKALSIASLSYISIWGIFFVSYELPSPGQTERHRCHSGKASPPSGCESESSGWPVGWTARRTRYSGTACRLRWQKLTSVIGFEKRKKKKKQKGKRYFYSLTWAGGLGSLDVTRITVGHIVALTLDRMCSVWETGAGWDWGSRQFEWNKRLKEKMCLKVNFEQFEGGVAHTCSLLVRWRQWWVIQRGGWPQGRGSARTLVAGGLPLSDEEAFMVTWFIFPSLVSLMSRIRHVFRSLPINLTRHFSGPRLCWCCGCRDHPVCSGWCVALWLLHLFFLHRGGCTERVEDDVLVFFPIARLWVRFGFDVALEE